MSHAARVTDPHVCPAVTNGVPHVGGPITGPGEPSIDIGGKVAAHQIDAATCTGPPDTLATGDPTVFMGNKPAVRVGDATAHGGVIVQGCPTVYVGATPIALALVEAARQGTGFVAR